MGELVPVPQSREAEEAVLGSVLINPDVYYDLATFFDAADFYVHRNRWIWEAFDRLVRGSVAIDVVTLQESLDAYGKLNELGGMSYITQLINAVPTSLNAVHYGKIVKEMATRRRMLETANEIAKHAYDLEADIDEAIQLSSGALYTVGFSDSKTYSGDEISAELDRHVTAASSGDDLPGIKTGLADLDYLLAGGYKPTRLYIIAGRPGKGKSGLIVTSAVAALNQKKRPLLFSLEMGVTELGGRAIAQEYNLDTRDIEVGRFKTSEDARKYQEGLAWLKQSGITIDTAAASTVQRVHALSKSMLMRGRCDIIFVDYLQLMTGTGYNREQEVSSISRGLKMIAMDLDVPVVAAAQLSRAVENRKENKPVLSDLRESGGIENDGNVVMFTWSVAEYQRTLTYNDVSVSVAKNRHGPIGDIDAKIVTRNTKFIMPNAVNGKVAKSKMIPGGRA